MTPAVRQVVLFGYCAEAKALFARMTAQPSGARKGQINTLIKALKAASAWGLLDGLIVEAAADAQASLFNWKQGLYNGTAVNSPTFTADRGYVGDGATSYIDTGFNPTTAVAPMFTQNAAHMGVWLGTDVTSSAQVDCGTTSARICGRSGTVAIMRGNETTNQNSAALSPSTSVGHSCWTRIDAAGFDEYKNGVLSNSPVVASSAPPNLSFYALASASVGPVAASFSTRRGQALHWGGALSAAQIAAINNALATYMTAVGA